MLNVAGFDKSKSCSRKMLGMFSFGGAGAGGGVRFNNDDVDDLFDSGDGVVSRDEPPDVTEAAEDNDGCDAPAVALCLT